jgi:hypothetical protein
MLSEPRLHYVYSHRRKLKPKNLVNSSCRKKLNYKKHNMFLTNKAINVAGFFATSVLWFLLAYLLIPWSRVLLEGLTGLQLVKKFRAFYGTRRFITALILPSHLRLGLPCGVFPTSFPTTTLYLPLPSAHVW